MKQKILQHIYASWWIYLLVGLCFMGGLVFGTLGVNSLNDKQVAYLNEIIDAGLTQFQDELDFSQTTRQAIVKNLYNLGKIVILGLTVIGLPLILVIIFTRGFVIGFTIVFLIKQKSFLGGALSLLAVVPPNILSLPAYFLAAVTAINFSLYLIKGRDPLRKSSLVQYFIGYLAIMTLFAILMISSGFIEGYLSPVFIRLIGWN